MASTNGYRALAILVRGITALAAILGTGHLSPSRVRSVEGREQHACRSGKWSCECGASLLETAVIVGIICTIALAAVPMIGKIMPETVCKVLPGFTQDLLALPYDDPLYFDQESGQWWCPVQRWNDQTQSFDLIEAFTGTVID